MDSTGKKPSKNDIAHNPSGKITMKHTLTPLAAARMDAGLTKLNLSRITGIPVRSITYWESGQRKPHIENLIKLSLSLGVNYRQLI